jgi:tetratricopeptide (TPR) repeat protein
MHEGVGYWIGRTLYLSLTNECNSVSLIASRGPGFCMPQAGGYAPLPRGVEPTAQDLVDYVTAAARGREDSLPEAVVFAGQGEPLLRIEVLLEAAQLLSRLREPPLPLRVNTNGLVGSPDCAATARRMRAVGITHASVALATAHPAQYKQLMRPAPLTVNRLTRSASGAPQLRQVSEYVGHEQVCDFARALVASGIDVECTAVAAPEVDLDAAASLAAALGARFRPRTYHAAPSSVSESARAGGPQSARSSGGPSSGPRVPRASSMDGARKSKEEGNALLREGKLAAALHCFREAILAYERLDLDPPEGYTKGSGREELSRAHAVAHANRALVLCRLGRAEEAHDDAKRALQLDRTYMKAYHRLGSALELLGRRDEAAEAFAVAAAKPMAFAAVRGMPRETLLDDRPIDE